MTEVVVRQAIFGPRPDGSNVRLLARSDGLDDAVLAEFSNFYFLAWEVSRQERDPFLTFVPLASGQWGLIRSHVLGERSMGLMFVSLLWVIDEIDLDRMGWRTERLWDALFEQQLVAPPEGSWLNSLSVTLGAEQNLPEALLAKADALAYSTDQALARGDVVRIPAFDGLEAPIRGLMCVLERLGPKLRGKSYCSSGLMAGSRFRPIDPRAGGSRDVRKPIDLVASTDPVGDADRSDVTLAATPPEAWIEQRWREHGIAPPAPRLDTETLRDLAVNELRANYDAIILRREFQGIGNLARADHAGRARYVAPYLLAEAMTALPDPAAAAEALNMFVADDLDHCPTDPRLTRPKAIIAVAAAESAALFWAAPAVIEKLGASELFGAGRQFDDGVREWMEASFSKHCASLGRASGASLATLLALMPDEPLFAELRNRLAVLLAVIDGGDTAALEQLIDENAGNLRAVVARLNELAALLPDGLRQLGRRTLERLREERICRVLEQPGSIEEALDAFGLGLQTVPGLLLNDAKSFGG